MPELSTPGDAPVRPGAMTAVMRAQRARPQGPRWLRWAVVRAGRIERETLCSPDDVLTIGVDGDVPAEGKKRVLLRFEDGAWHLAPGLRGRTGEGTIEELSEGGTRDVRLSDTARARLELSSGVSLLVQLVDRPPVKTTPQLPASLRGGFLSGADWWFTSFVAASLCLHLGVVTFLLEADWPVETELVPLRYAETIFPEVDEPPEDVPEMTDGEGDEVAENDEGDEADADDAETDAEPSDRQPTRRADRRPAPRSTDPSPTLDQEAIDRQVAEHLAIVTRGLGNANSAFDALREGARTESAAAIFDTVDGAEVATSEPGRLHDRDGTGQLANVTGGLDRLARRPGNTGRRTEGEEIVEVDVTRPPGIAPPIFEPPEIDDPDFDPRDLIARLRGRMPAVRRCYEHTLSHGDPDAAGRITLAMQVMPPGNLAQVRAAENTTGSSSLAACVVRSVRTVRVRTGPEMPTHVEFPIVLARQ